MGEELRRLGGRSAPYLREQVERAAAAFVAGRDREVIGLLRPVRERVPDAVSVRELLGLSLYRDGRYRDARRELEAFARLTGSTEHHPVLMDCARAQGRYARVEELWAELARASPGADVVTEGRIVRAGARADQGDLAGALALLRPAARRHRRPDRPHVRRLWYALADLEERAGNLATARRLWAQLRAADPTFADVTERLRAIS